MKNYRTLLLLVLISLPCSAYGWTESIDRGVAWLLANQNPSGSWGNADPIEFRDTTVAADALSKIGEKGLGYVKAVNFIKTFDAGNNDYLARKMILLAQDGHDVSELVSDLLSTQCVALQGDTKWPLNPPEGGWGAAKGYATNNLDTALALKAMSATGLAGGRHLFYDRTVLSGEMVQLCHQFQLPDGTTSLTLTFEGFFDADIRIQAEAMPDLSTPSYRIRDYGMKLELPEDIDIPVGSGVYYVTITNATYYHADASLVVTYIADGLDTKHLLKAVEYLLASQNPDGGWGLSKGLGSNIYLTSIVLLALVEYFIWFDLKTPISNGIEWLKSCQNKGGGFGEEQGSIYETALAYAAIADGDPLSPEAPMALNHLLLKQQSNGSWNDNPYDTALSLSALCTSLQPLDLDRDGMPDDWEQQIIDANPDDAIVDITDVLPNADFDGDGETNLTEYLNGTDPTDPMSCRLGDLNNDKRIDLVDVILALKVVAGLDTNDLNIPSNSNLGGDQIIGLKEALYVLQKIAEN